MNKVVPLSILFLIVSVFTAVAQEENFGISINCVEDCKDKEIDNSKDIMLVVTIKNKFDYWVSLGDKDAYSSLRITIENTNLENGKQDILFPKPLGDTVFIKPQSEKEIYIPLDIYNKLGGDNRIGTWAITPEITIKSQDIKFYKHPFDSEATPLYRDRKQVILPSTIKGNILEFKSVKPEINVKEPPISIDWTSPIAVYLVYPLLVLIIGSIVVGIIVKKK